MAREIGGRGEIPAVRTLMGVLLRGGVTVAAGAVLLAAATVPVASMAVPLQRPDQSVASTTDQDIYLRRL